MYKLLCQWNLNIQRQCTFSAIICVYVVTAVQLVKPVYRKDDWTAVPCSIEVSCNPLSHSKLALTFYHLNVLVVYTRTREGSYIFVSKVFRRIAADCVEREITFFTVISIPLVDFFDLWTIEGYALL